MKLFEVLLYYFVVDIHFVHGDKVAENEAKISFLAKELTSLHRSVDSKISTLKEEMVKRKHSDDGYRYYFMKSVYRKIQDLNFQMMTLKLDIRQLFYEGLFMKTDMKYYVKNKTDTLEKYIKDLRASVWRIYTKTNVSIEGDPMFGGTNNSEIIYIDESNSKSDETDSLPQNKDPLQDMEITLEVGKKFTVSCELENEDKINANSLHWYRNGRRIESSSLKYSIVNGSGVSTLTVPRLRQKDFGIFECKDKSFRVIMRIHLYVKEHCNEFLCDGTCVDLSSVCNGVKDCPRGQDESSCELIADVLRGEVQGSGTVIVLLNKMQGRLCHDGWDVSAAQVLCRSLGYGSGEPGPPIRQTLKKGFLVSAFKCTGDEDNLSLCHRTITNLKTCDMYATTICI